MKLKLFDGSLMKPCGIATLKIHRGNTTQIVETVNKPHLSAETCVKLELLKLSFTGTAPVNSMGTEPAKYSVPLTRERRILADHKDVFEGLGHIGESSTLVISPNHSPVQHAPSRILQKEVKEKIAELEKKDIIQKVRGNFICFIGSVVIWNWPHHVRGYSRLVHNAS